MKSKVPVNPGTLRLKAGVLSATIWSKQNFAESWFRNALNEAHGEDLDAKLREIVFAVCFAESYLVEWVRDEICRGSLGKLADYFPSGSKMGAMQKWKKIPKQVLPNGIDWDGNKQYWRDWDKLVKFRNGLVHASVSRPHSASQPAEANPKPTPQELHDYPHGKATKVVFELVRELHEAADTNPPDRLVDP